MKMNKWFILILLTFFLSACEESYIPKPRGYYRIAMPKKEYQKIKEPNFSFDILKSCTLSYKTTDSSWSTIAYPPINADLYLTYFNDTNLEKLTEDARKSAYKHTIKADDIINLDFAIPDKNLYGIVYSIEGDAASPVIFFFTDSVRQFLHGAVYFNCEPNADSLKPSVHFIRQDIEHIIETFEWNSNHSIEQ